MNTMQMTQERQKYKYFAFVSYSHADKRTASRLQKTLERYYLPARVQRKHEKSPRRAYPVFRDDTDLHGFKVWPSIAAELDRSQYLVVVCSPKSAASPWVNREIQHFIDTGKEDKILPFIAEGIPYSGDPATECFPPALRDMEDSPLGVDLQKQGWQKSCLSVISTLLNVDFDELLMRDFKRRLRNRIAGAAALACSLAVAGGLLYYNTEHSTYYRDYIYRNEIPVGIYELSDKERAAMHVSCRITKCRGKTVRLERVNSYGVVIDLLTSGSVIDYPVEEFEYDDAGNLIKVIQKASNGQLMTEKQLTAEQDQNVIAIDFRFPSSRSLAQALPADMSAYIDGDRSVSEKSEIIRQYNTYDANGYLILSMYHRDALGTPACDSNGVYGKAYTYNDMGQISQISNLNARGEPYNCKYGWAVEKFTYNELGQMVLREYLDAEGNAVRGRDGYAALGAAYDAAGNLTVVQNLDENGNKINNSYGYAMQKVQYDKQGFIIGVKNYDAEEKPVYNKDGYHELRFVYDSKGRYSGEFYYGTQGQLVYSPSASYAGMEMVLDDAGNVVEFWCYDTENNRMYSRKCEAYGRRAVYDENGYLAEVELLDAEGNPAMGMAGYSKMITQHNSQGQRLREEFRDTSGNLVRAEQNAAIVECGFDVYGNTSEMRCYDENGQPCYCEDGYFLVRREYEKGNLISEKYYNTEEKPTFCRDFYHEVRKEYENGNCIRWSYYDVDGHLVETRDGYAIAEQSYDEYGNVLSKRLYNGVGEPAVGAGIYEVRWSYDRRGNKVREELYTVAPEDQNYVISEYTYDAYGNCIEGRYYGADGEPTTAEGQAYRIHKRYDPQGNVLYEEHRYIQNPERAAIRTYEYDEFGNRIRECNFRLEDSGELIPENQVINTFDAYGNGIRTDYLDGQGEPRLLEAGYSSVACGYTPAGNVEWFEYYDDKGQPCLREGIAFRYEFKYDSAGRKLEERHYGTDGQLIRYDTTSGYAVAKHVYDSRGTLLRTDYFDEKNERINAIQFELDVFGNRIGCKEFDADNNLLVEKQFVIGITAVREGSMASQAGITGGYIVIELGDWNYFLEDSVSHFEEMRMEILRASHKEKDLILCSVGEDDTVKFRRFHFPKGVMGIQFASQEASTVGVEMLREAYQQWLKENP